MTLPTLVLDTSVIVAAMRSRTGASFQLVDWIDEARFVSYLSNPMIYEFIEVTHRLVGQIGLNLNEINDILNYIVGNSRQTRLYYAWRPVVRDPNDDLIAEAAISANCDYIVTHNIRDFAGLDRFGIKVVTPGDFVRFLKGGPTP